MRVGRVGLVPLLACLAAVVASCASHGVTQVSDGPQYSCCLASGVENQYHAGDAITLHWIVNPARGAADTTDVQIELTATIVGPFASVANLKSAVTDKATAGIVTVSAEPIHPSGAPGEQPVSIILIPQSAVPGFYNLEWSATDPGGSVRAGSVVQVVPTT